MGDLALAALNRDPSASRNPTSAGTDRGIQVLTDLRQIIEHGQCSWHTFQCQLVHSRTAEQLNAALCPHASDLFKPGGDLRKNLEHNVTSNLSKNLNFVWVILHTHTHRFVTATFRRKELGMQFLHRVRAS